MLEFPQKIELSPLFYFEITVQARVMMKTNSGVGNGLTIKLKCDRPFVLCNEVPMMKLVFFCNFLKRCIIFTAR